jgi:hypothetical protein
LEKALLSQFRKAVEGQQVCIITDAKRRDLGEGKNCDKAERETPGRIPVGMVSDGAQLGGAGFLLVVLRDVVDHDV